MPVCIPGIVEIGIIQRSIRLISIPQKIVLWNEKYSRNTRKWKEKKDKDLERVGLKYIVSRSKVNINFILSTTFITLKSYFLMADGKNKSLVSYFCSSHHFSLDRSNVTPSEILHEYITYTSIYIFTLSSIFMDKW